MPSSGIVYYEVWRSADGANWGTDALAVWTNLASLSYSDATAGWSTKWYYRVRAFDAALNPGAWSATASATTVAEPFHDLHISVKSGNNGCVVWVLNSGDQHYYDVNGVDRGTTPPTGTAIPKNSSVTFMHLPDGAYVVYASAGAFSTNSTYGANVKAPYGVLTGVAP